MINMKWKYINTEEFVKFVNMFVNMTLCSALGIT